MSPRRLTRPEKKALEYLERAKLAIADPWYFILLYALTHDEHDKTVESKHFPQKLYIRVMVRAALEHPTLFIEKSRQIMATWTFVALAVHDILFAKNRRGAFQSTKDETATALIKRAQFMYSHIYKHRGQEKGFPAELLPEPKWSKGRAGTDSEMEIPENNSRIQAVVQGGEVFASYTFSWVLGDEISKQRLAEEGYRCAIPTLQKDSHWWGPATANGKVWNWQKMYGWDKMQNDFRGERIVDSYNVPIKRYTESELLNMPSKQFNAIPLEELVACIPGMRFWIMRLDEEKTPCLRIHYSADPEKRPGTKAGDAWYQRERPKYSKPQWDREFEIRYDTFEGRPVISNWEHNTFVRDELKHEPKMTMGIPVDFGTRHCGAFFSQKCQVEKYSFYQARIYAELILRRPKANSIILAEGIVDILKNLFPDIWENRRFVLYPDPAGHKQSETTADQSLNTSIKILESYGLPCLTKKFSIPESTEFVETIFSRTSPGGDPGVLVHRRCEYLISCYDGGWHFPDKPIGMEDGKPEKDGEYDHGGDLTRYDFGNMFNIEDVTEQRRRFTAVPDIPVREKYTGRVVGYRNPQTRRRLRNYARGIH
jgi:hypothetical protein